MPMKIRGRLASVMALNLWLRRLRGRRMLDRGRCELPQELGAIGEVNHPLADLVPLVLFQCADLPHTTGATARRQATVRDEVGMGHEAHARSEEHTSEL